MKKIVPALLAFSVCILAADVWQSKPFTEWSDKDLQKLMTNSPWAKEVSLSMPGGGSGGGSGKGGGKRGGGGGGGDMSGDTPMSGPATGSGGGNANARAGVQEVGGAAPAAGGGSAMTLSVRWQSALPLRQAVAKQKYGAEAATSPDAKKLLDSEQKYYAIVVAGLPGRAAHVNDEMKPMLLKSTTLSVKGKDPITAIELQSGGNEQKAVVMFFFPKTTVIDADDKEVEFSSKVGPLVVKQKFKLKEMIFNGKLEL